MKKGLKTVGLILMCLLFTTGCYDYNVEMSVNDDRSVDFKMGLDVDFSKAAEMMGTDLNESENVSLDDLFGDEENDLADSFAIDEESAKSLNDRGYSIDQNKEGYKYSFKISKKFDNIDDISSEEEVKVDIDKVTESDFKDVFFKAKKGLFKTTYTAYFVFDLNTDGMSEIEAYKDYFKTKFVLNLPDKSINNNATSLSNDGKTLNWDLELGKKNEVICEFEMLNGNIQALVGGGIGIVALISAMAVLIVKLFNKKNPIEKEIA